MIQLTVYPSRLHSEAISRLQFTVVGVSGRFSWSVTTRVLLGKPSSETGHVISRYPPMVETTALVLLYSILKTVIMNLSKDAHSPCNSGRIYEQS